MWLGLSTASMDLGSAGHTLIPDAAVAIYVPVIDQVIGVLDVAKLFKGDDSLNGASEAGNCLWNAAVGRTQSIYSHGSMMYMRACGNSVWSLRVP